KLLPGPAVQADIVYSNSNLGEMSLIALKHVLHISRHMLAASDLGVFMYFTSGCCKQNTPESIAVEFTQFGYHPIPGTPFPAYVLNRDRAASVASAFKDGIPHINPNGSDVRLTANDVMSLRRAEAPLDVQLTAWNRS